MKRKITEIGLEKAIQKIKLGKTAGHDRIYPETVKHRDKAGNTMLFNVIKSAWKYKMVSKDWRTSVNCAHF
jgi:hypothetical protein